MTSRLIYSEGISFLARDSIRQELSKWNLIESSELNVSIEHLQLECIEACRP